MQTTLFNQSYQDKIATLFKKGETLTVASVFSKVKTLELRHFVAVLRKGGMPIVDEWQVNANGKRYKSYWLYKEAN